MALDKLTFCNQAAGLIGADPIDALDEDTPGAQAISLLYDSLLEWCMGLRDGGWTFGKATRQCSQRSDVTPLSGWSKVYALPADRIGPPVKLAPSADWPRQKFTEYSIEGNDVHCNETALYALVPILPEPPAMHPAFRRAFMVGLAADLYFALASDKDGRDRLRAEAFGPPSMNGLGGLMATAIQIDRASEPSRGPVDGSDPLTNTWRS